MRDIVGLITNEEWRRINSHFFKPATLLALKVPDDNPFLTGIGKRLIDMPKDKVAQIPAVRVSERVEQVKPEWVR